MNIGIIGAGTMGKGIAIEFARYGYKVVLLSAQRHLDTADLKKELTKISQRYKDINHDDVCSNITMTNEFADLSGCDFIIEAVSENLDIKREIVYKALPYLNKSVIFSTNTSSLSIKDVFIDIVDLDKVCGLHFFNPVQVMKLVELSYLEESSEKTIETAKNLALSLKKEFILVKNSPGFIVNRLLIPFINEATKIVESGIASIEDIDKAMQFGANHPIGPLKLSDLIGNDITLNILNSLQKSFNLEISELLISTVKENKLGRKTKQGFYSYKD
jgi:3-hydroxybutyryl-CoA dehydrogenase